MSTLKVTNIENPSTTSGGIDIDTSGHVTVDGVAMPSAGPLSNRNKIINGDMRIDQRNAGASVTITTSGTYTLDRWVAWMSQASKFSVQRNAGSVTPPSGFTNYIGVTSLAATSLAAGDYFSINQSIEGFNTADFAWGTASAVSVTLSFWVRSSLTGTFGGALSNAAYSRAYPFSYSISAANTWEKKTITIAGDTTGTWETDNGSGIVIYFSLGMGSTYSATAGTWTAGQYLSATGATSVVGTNGATFYITGVQLEVGSVATPFEHRSYGDELLRCQRYFVKLSEPRGRGVVGTVGNVVSRVGGSLPVSMRIAPNITMSGTFSWFDGINVGTITGLASTYSTPESYEFDAGMATGSSAAYRPALLYQGANVGSLSADAEL